MGKKIVMQHRRMDSTYGREVVRKYAKELDVEYMGERFIMEGESREGQEGFWCENFTDAQQVRDAFYEDYYSGSPEAVSAKQDEE